MELGILKNEAKNHTLEYFESMACAEHHINAVKLIKYL